MSLIKMYPNFRTFDHTMKLIHLKKVPGTAVTKYFHRCIYDIIDWLNISII